MKTDELKRLTCGALLYRVCSGLGDMTVVEYRLTAGGFDSSDVGDAEPSALHSVCVERTKYDGRPVPSGRADVERLSLRGLVADFALTPVEAVELYVQRRAREEMQAQARLDAAKSELAKARASFASWLASGRQVW